jgi:GNAT superfamily N-acetyltransferase
VFNVRPATPEDVPRIWELVLGLAEFERLSDAVTGSQESFAGGLGRDFECWVGIADGKIVGYMLGFRTYSTFRARAGFWLEDLFVEPRHRGKGFGKCMLGALIDYAAAEGLGRLEWSVLDWNESAIRFYERMGATVMPDWRTCRISF